jgi:pimeloyl-ACP methyl ester carboxylesterase
MKKKLLNLLKVLVGLYVILCGLLYFFQEKVIFHPEKLPDNYAFNFDGNPEELSFKATDGKLLNGLLFKAENSKGLIFYLHGNAGSLRTWGYVAETYTALNYDVFILDYRSFGKSQGQINSQAQLFEDNQLVYDAIKKQYDEKNIIVLGYSIGTGMAAKLASDNHPQQLILQAPYYSLTDLMRQKFPFAPTFLLTYKFATNDYLARCVIPITIFHGTQDAVIPYTSSVKLKEEFNAIHLITLNGQGHGGITDNTIYKNELRKILSKE